MTKDELLGLVTSEIFQAEQVTDLEKERSDAMKYYLGEPLGTELPGRSKIVDSTVSDAIEWIKPSLMRIFTSTDKVVSFDPFDPDDEDGAKQETEIVNHTFYKENDGFVVLYTMINDALMQKTGVVKFWWDDDEEKVREEYTGLNDDELALLLSDETVEPIEHTQVGEFHDIVVMKTNSSGRVQVEPVPPEEFYISSDATSINPQKARFTCHKTLKTRPELRAMGFPKKIVNDLPAYGHVENEEEFTRDNLHERNFESSNKHAEHVELHESYIRVDFDGDGLAELRQVFIAGNKIIKPDGQKDLAQEVDAVPFAAITPIILSHKFYGRSIADRIMDLQDIRTALLRGVLDNTYNANNSRTAAQDGRVNLDDLLTSRPGGIVRTDGPPSQVLMPIPHNPLPQQTFEVLAQTEKMRKERTGVSDESMGLDANTLAHARTGAVSQSFDASRMMQELIARIFSETGIKQLFLGIHRLLQQNQDKPKWFRMRGEWVSVNPSEWRERINMTVNVGLGTGNKDRELQGLQSILGIQEKLLGTGQGVTPQNVYDTLEKFIEALGYRDVTTFFTDPDTQDPPEKEDPEAELAMAQVQVANNSVQVSNKEAETNKQEAIWKHEEALMKIQSEERLELRNQDMLDARERTKMEVQLEIARTNQQARAN